MNTIHTHVCAPSYSWFFFIIIYFLCITPLNAVIEGFLARLQTGRPISWWHNILGQFCSVASWRKISKFSRNMLIFFRYKFAQSSVVDGIPFNPLNPTTTQLGSCSSPQKLHVIFYFDSLSGSFDYRALLIDYRALFSNCRM